MAAATDRGGSSSAGRPTTKRRPAGGFTLLEVTVAALVTALITLTLAGALATVTASWERSEALYAGRTAAMVIGDRLRRELASMAQSPFGLGSGFEGGPDGFSFFSSSDEGLRHLEIAREEDRVILRLKALRRPPGDDERSVVLAAGLGRVECSYYDASVSDWRSEWRDSAHKRPPALVRLELHPARGGAAVPPLIFPLQPGRVIASDGVDPFE